MKLLIKLSFVLMLTTVFISCAKKPDATGPGLDGEWELRHVNGIQVANVNPNFAPGNGNILKFNNGKLEKYSNGKLVDTMSYTIQKDTMKINNTQSSYRIDYANHSKQYFKLDSGKLVIFDGMIAADGTESTYEKK